MTTAELLKLVGKTAHGTLQAALGGTTVRIPRDPLKLLRKVPRLAPNDAENLCRKARGEVIYFANGKHDDKPLRDALVRTELANAKSVNEVALAYGLCERQVRRIKKGM